MFIGLDTDKTETPSSRMISKEQERELVERAQQGSKQAAYELLRAFEPLIAGQIKHFTQHISDTNDPRLKDIRQEAINKFLYAVQRFDVSRDVRLGTLAMYHVRGGISEHTNTFSGPVRLGKNAEEKSLINNFQAKKTEIERQTGRPLCDKGRQRIADELNVDIKRLKDMEPRLTKHDVSMEAQIPDPDTGEQTIARSNAIASEAPSPIEILSQREYTEAFWETIHTTFEQMSPRLRYIMERRWLIDSDETAVSLSKVAEELDMGRERVRQLEIKGKQILAHALLDSGLAPADADKTDVTTKKSKRAPKNNKKTKTPDRSKRRRSMSAVDDERNKALAASCARALHSATSHQVTPRQAGASDGGKVSASSCNKENRRHHKGSGSNRQKDLLAAA